MSSQASRISGLALTGIVFVTFALAAAGDVSCPASWLARNETSECYFISNDIADFFSASAKCQNFSATMASILDSETNKFLVEAVQQTSGCHVQPSCSNFWIGLYRSNESSSNIAQSDPSLDWMWLDGSNYSLTWNMWNISRPIGNRVCASLSPVQGEWINVNCSMLLPFICHQKMQRVTNHVTPNSVGSVSLTQTPDLDPKTSSSAIIINNGSVTSPPSTKSSIPSSQISSSDISIRPNSTTSVTLSGSSSSRSTILAAPVSTSSQLTTERISASQVTSLMHLSAITSVSSVDITSPTDGFSDTSASEADNSTASGITTGFIAMVTDGGLSTVTNMVDDHNSSVIAPIKESTIPMLAIYIAVPLGVVIVMAIIISACVLYCRRKHRRKDNRVSITLNDIQPTESSNEYENLDSITTFINVRDSIQRIGHTSYLLQRRTLLPSTPQTIFAHVSTDLRPVPLDEYRQLNEQLLTLKRPLENSVIDGVFSEDLISLITNTSLKIVEIIWHSSGNDERRHSPVIPALCSFSCEFLSSNVLVLESLISLQMKIISLLRIFPADGALPVIDRCRRSLESVDALLKVAMENISYTSLIKTDSSDVLFDTNPLFQELLGLVTIIRLRLETYYVLGSCVEPEDSWKSKLLNFLSKSESMVMEVFSDVMENSDASEEDPETVAGNETEAVVEGESFHDILEQKLQRFHQSINPILPQVKQFLQGVDSNAANYVCQNLDEIDQLSANILSPRTLLPLTFFGETNAIYQNLTGVYDVPSTSIYNNISTQQVEEQSSDYYRLGWTGWHAEDDTYEPSPVLLRTSEDISSSYSYDEDNFEVSVDRTSTSWLENVFQLYREAPLDHLQRNIKVSFVGEAGVDGGALSREFFFMLFNELVSQPFLSHGLFEGSRGHLLPAIDHVLTDAKAFWFLGVLTAQAVNRGCRGLPGLCNAIRHFLFMDAKVSNIAKSLEKVTADDIADVELRTVIEKVLQNETLEDAEKSVFENWAIDSSFSKMLNPSTNNEAVQRIFCHYVFNSRMTQIQAFAEGMNDIGIKNRQAVDIERMFPIDEKLSFDDFMSGILIEPSNTSQKKARDYFKRFCQELDRSQINNLTLEDLLCFFTGAPYFVSMIGAQVRFAEPLEKNTMPVAHACSSELILPIVHKNYPSFREAMIKALEYSGAGFGLV